MHNINIISWEVLNTNYKENYFNIKEVKIKYSYSILKYNTAFFLYNFQSLQYINIVMIENIIIIRIKWIKLKTTSYPGIIITRDYNIHIT